MSPRPLTGTATTGLPDTWSAVPESRTTDPPPPGLLPDGPAPALPYRGACKRGEAPPACRSRTVGQPTMPDSRPHDAPHPPPGRGVPDVPDGGFRLPPTRARAPDALADPLLQTQSAWAGEHLQDFIGSVRIPVGIAGPLRVNGLSARGDYSLPLATTDPGLIAVSDRGVTVGSTLVYAYCEFASGDAVDGEAGAAADAIRAYVRKHCPVRPLAEAARVSPAPLPGGLLPTPTGQGRRVSAEVILPAHLVVARLETTVQQIAPAWRGPAGGARGGLSGGPRGARER